MRSIGAALARLHSTTTTHGDLTTSNMMVRLTPGKAQPYEILSSFFGVLILRYNSSDEAPRLLTSRY